MLCKKCNTDCTKEDFLGLCFKCAKKQSEEDSKKIWDFTLALHKPKPALLPRKGALAFCGANCLGLITGQVKEIKSPNGDQHLTWVGIHLTNKTSFIGAPWASRNPKVVAYIQDFEREHYVFNHLPELPETD